MWDSAWSILSILPWGLACVLGVTLSALRLPGNWVIVLIAAGYGWWTEWEHVGWKFLALLGGIAVLAEVLEQLVSVFAARRAGASRRAAWGGLIGGFMGMFLLSFLVPIPVVGSMVGAIVGCFAGAMAAELSVQRQVADGTRAGVFAVLGFVLGSATKLAVTFAMAGILLSWIAYSAFSPKAQSNLPSNADPPAVEISQANVQSGQ
ncbi:MAG: DUF456 domain-containing protein [Planctomycetes bacterium]|nr:DUF456 domain-containing protein [Planctomycetota bacterium]